jgi:LysM repeat protein
MKGLKLYFLFLIILSACGQQRRYISHTVKQGETIKSIAKDYGIKSKELMQLNPDVSRNLGENTVIIVPNKNINTSKVTVNEGFHTVLKKETLFSIAQKYGVTVDGIKQINNLFGDALSIGRVIQIPVKKEGPEVIEEVVDSNAIMHEVVKDDTVYNLTKKYEITEDELYAMNPTLKDGLKLGMHIKIGEKSIEVESELNLFRDSITNKLLNVVLMLPYKLNSIDVDNEAFIWNNKLLNITSDFHAGALIAIDSLRQQGMQIKLDVIDTEESSSKTSKIIENYNFEKVDVIVGPLFMNLAKQVSRGVSNVPVVAPIFSNTQNKISVNNLIKTAPDKSLLYEKMANYLLDNYEDEKVIIIGDNSANSAAAIGRLSSIFRKNSIGDITVLKPSSGYIANDRFMEVIDTIHKRNWVILASDDNIVTTTVVNNLGVMPLEKRAIRLFAFNKGDNFRDVSSNQLARLKFTFAASEFTDISSLESQYFQKRYKVKNYVRPSEYAIRGFDVMYDTLLRLSNAFDFNEGASQGVSQRIIRKFDYEKRPFGSSENKGVFIIQYQDSLELLAID